MGTLTARRQLKVKTAVFPEVIKRPLLTDIEAAFPGP